jgi:hypothetical protein
MRQRDAAVAAAVAAFLGVGAVAFLMNRSNHEEDGQPDGDTDAIGETGQANEA